AAQVAVNLGGPENLAFYRLKGDDLRQVRPGEVKQAYVPGTTSLTRLPVRSDAIGAIPSGPSSPVGPKERS
ncbi:MAG: hypothetical protein ACE5HP_05785, partial [Gemmatimonadota bacterium]